MCSKIDSCLPESSITEPNKSKKSVLHVDKIAHLLIQNVYRKLSSLGQYIAFNDMFVESCYKIIVTLSHWFCKILLKGKRARCPLQCSVAMTASDLCCIINHIIYVSANEIP